MLQENGVNGAAKQLRRRVVRASRKASAQIVERLFDLSDLLLAAPLPTDSLQMLIQQITSESDPSRRIAQAIITLGAMPEFNLAALDYELTRESVNVVNVERPRRQGIRPERIW